MPPYPLEQVTSSAVEKMMHDLVDEGEASHGFLSPKELCLREVAISNLLISFPSSGFVSLLISLHFPN
jgi:hypothetical protein